MNKLCLVGQMYFVSPDSFTVEPCYEKKLLIGSSDPVTVKNIYSKYIILESEFLSNLSLSVYC